MGRGRPGHMSQLHRATAATVVALAAGSLVAGCGSPAVDPPAPWAASTDQATLTVALSAGVPSEWADARWVLSGSDLTRTEQVEPGRFANTSVQLDAEQRSALQDLALDAMRGDDEPVVCAEPVTVSVATSRGDESLTTRTYRVCPGTERAVLDLVRAADAPLPAACPPPAPCAPPCTRTDPFERWGGRGHEVTDDDMVQASLVEAGGVPAGPRCTPAPPTPTPSATHSG